MTSEFPTYTIHARAETTVTLLGGTEVFIEQEDESVEGGKRTIVMRGRANLNLLIEALKDIRESMA